MLFAIHCLDDPSTPTARSDLYPQHRAFLDSPAKPIILAGPLLDADGETRIGSLLVIEAEDLDDARRFAASDPFALNKVWKTIVVHGFLKLVENRVPDAA